VNRYYLSADAELDFDEIIEYLSQLPQQPADRIGASIQHALERISDNPFVGRTQSDLTRRFGVEIRSWLVGTYRLIYRLDGTAPEIIGLLHTSRDITSIMGQRLN